MRCDVCLGDDNDATSSPDLSLLIHKHLGIIVQQEILSCEACTQLLHLWDDFSNQAKTNLKISQPDVQQTMHQKPNEDDASSTIQDLKDNDISAAVQNSIDSDSSAMVTETVEHCTPELPADLRENERETLITDAHENALLDKKGSFYKSSDDLKETTKDTDDSVGQYNCSESVDFQMIEEEEKKFSCTYCSKTFITEISKQMHERSVHWKQMRKGSFGGQKRSIEEPSQFTQKIRKSLSPNDKEDHSNKLSCPFCNGRLSTQFQMNQHIRLCHSNDEPESRHHRNQPNPNYHIPSEFVCEACGVDLGSKFKLEGHMKSRHDVTIAAEKSTYTCTYCNQVLSCRKTLVQHIKHFHCQHITNLNTSYVCRICNRNLLTKAALIQHLKYHDREKKTDTRVDNKKVTNKSVDRFNDEILLSIADQKYKFRDGLYFCNFCLKSDKDVDFIKKHIIEYHLSTVNQNLSSTSMSENSDIEEKSESSTSTNLDYKTIVQTTPNDSVGSVSKLKYFGDKFLTAVGPNWSCNFCGKLFKTLCGSDYHILRHMHVDDALRKEMNFVKRNESHYECLLCKKILNTETGILQHIRCLH